MREISIQDIKNISIGQVENREGGTGCTVLISRDGMPAGMDVRGGGPASRESELLHPLAAAQVIHGILLAGGSAFGLDAAGGVMSYLEEQGIGLPVGPTRVPLICQADIFDLGVGDFRARPDQNMGRRAAEIALSGGNYRDGGYGAGCGATVGKICGPSRCMKSGIGSYAVQLGDLQVGAIVVVNAIGDICDHRTGQKVAGLLTEDKMGLADSEQILYAMAEAAYAAQKEESADTEASTTPLAGANQTASPGPLCEEGMPANTTIGVILTNAKFDKTALCKIAGMAHDGYARSIRPIHTSMDGDTIYALSLGEVSADRDLVGTLAANVMSEAILKAVRSAEGAYGIPSIQDLHRGNRVDIVDLHGNPTGLYHDRANEPKEGQFFRAVTVAIFNKEGKLIIQQRQSSKKLWPDLWDISACGAFDIGDDPQSAAMREVKEELGLTLDLSKARPGIVTTFKTGFTYAFVVKTDVRLEDIVLQEEEVQDVRLATKEEVFAMMEEGTFINYKRPWIEYLFELAEEGYRF